MDIAPNGNGRPTKRQWMSDQIITNETSMDGKENSDECRTKLGQTSNKTRIDVEQN
jgi:hypothetical protein